MLEGGSDGIFRILVIVVEINNLPWSLNVSPVLAHIVNEDSFDKALVQQSCERVSGVNKFRAGGVTTRLMNAFASWRRVPAVRISPVGYYLSRRQCGR